MSIRISTLLTAGALAVLLAAGSFVPAQAGDGEGCTKGKKDKDTSTFTMPVEGMRSGA